MPARSNRIRSLLLVLVLTLPTLAVISPPAAAQGACVASVTLVNVTPFYAAHGSTTTLLITVNDTSGAPRVPGLGPPKAKVTLTGTYSDQATNVFDANSQLEFHPNPSDTQTIPIDIPAGAPHGKATIHISKDDSGAGNCTWDDPRGLGYDWGFWVDDKPDLKVTDLKLIRHDVNTGAANDFHDPMQPDELFTRYPDVVGSGGAAVCNEQRTGREAPQGAGLPPRYSHAHIDVALENLGAADFAQPSTEATGPRSLNVSLLVTDNGVVLGTFRVQLNGPMAAGGNGDASKTNVTISANVWSLVDRAGAHNIVVTVDPNGEYAESSESNNVGSKEFVINAPQLVAAFNSVTLTADHRLKGSITLTNNGTKRAGAPVSANDPSKDNLLCMSRTGTDFTARVYLDTIDTSHVVLFNGENITTTLDPQASITKTFPVNGGPTVSAGDHTLIVMANDRLHADNISDTFYLTELNFTAPHPFPNTACCNLLDNLITTLQNVTLCVASGCGTSLQGNAGGFVNISGDVVDDSDFTATSDNVFFDITYPNGTTVVPAFHVPHGTPTAAAGMFVQNFSNQVDVRWWFNSTFADEGQYSLHVRAVDSAGHTASFPSVGALGFLLQSFPKTMQMYQFQLCNEAAYTGPDTASHLQDCVSPNSTGTNPAGKNFTRDGNGAPLDGFKMTFRIPPGATGLGNETRNVSRMTLQVTTPDAPEGQNGGVLGNFSVTPLCYYTQTVPPGPDDCPAGTAGVDEVCQPTSLVCYNYFYRVTLTPNVNLTSVGGASPTCSYPPGQNVQATLFEPALWNLTLWVGDNACTFRKWDLGNLPAYVDNVGNLTSGLAPMQFWLFDSVPGVIENATQTAGTGGSVAAKTDLVFRADLYDDIKVKRGFTQLLKFDGLAEQLVLQENMTASRFWGINQTTLNGTYSVSIPTGFGKKVCDAGTYHWRIGMMDANHTLSFKDGNVSVTDLAAPAVEAEAAAHGGAVNAVDTAFQVLENITIRANVTDDTCFSVVAVVQDNAGQELFRKPMSLVPGTVGVYRSADITTGATGADLPEGAYQFFVEAVDSRGNKVDSGVHAFIVAGDLAPTFTNLVPSGGFGKPDQVVSVDVNDLVQGVSVGNLSASFGVNDGALAPVSAADLQTQVTSGTGSLATVVHLSFTVHATARARASTSSTSWAARTATTCCTTAPSTWPGTRRSSTA
ncbi:MAG: hypothetical protein LC624_01870 [Halobacteriales archaeon]|nr:hypothetical protein [Halobacteriales archaeon]